MIFALRMLLPWILAGAAGGLTGFLLQLQKQKLTEAIQDVRKQLKE